MNGTNRTSDFSFNGKMPVGVDYYPEHWKRERWALDARLMREAGFNIVRLTEFAWGFMEPAEGEYDFSLFDDALKVLGDHGLFAILGTPTAVVPAWMVKKYPDIMAMKPDGSRKVWGVRKDACYNSSAYQIASERITRAMAEHFRDTPNVIGWQTDNEFDGHECHCTLCQSDFRNWLQGKYGTVEKLNEAWGTHFWGQLYRAWDEIQSPADMINYNPSLCLDWKRYMSWVNVRFQREQVKIIREVCPHHFVTHNTMSFFPAVDCYGLCEDLDFASWDNYPIYLSPSVMYGAAAGADLVRGFKGKNFWIMEQTAGPAGWGVFARNVRPGELRLIAYQQLAHGCDGMLWFRWRSCTAGREQYWHGLLGHDGVPRRRYQEAARTAGEFQSIWPEIEGTTVKPEVAILYDYDCVWANEIQPSYVGNNAYQDLIQRMYDPLLRAGVNADIVPTTADFSKYKLILAPGLYVMPDELALRLEQFVKEGGVFVTDTRTGVKTETSLCHERPLPGLLADTLGIIVEEYEGLGHMWNAGSPCDYKLTGKGVVNGTFTAPFFTDWMKVTTAEPLAEFDSPTHMKGSPAATRNSLGKGWGYYVGTVVAEIDFYDQLIRDALQKAGIDPVLLPPLGVEVCVREGQGRKIIFILNQSGREQIVPVPSGKKELITGITTSDSIKLQEFEVAVIKLQ